MIPVLLLGATPVVGVAALRRTRSAANFFVAGRRPGACRTGLAIAATFRPPAPEGLATLRHAAAERAASPGRSPERSPE